MTMTPDLARRGPICAAARHDRATDARNHRCCCAPSRAALAAQRAARRRGEGDDPFVDALATVRRIRSLQADGFSFAAIAARLGVIPRVLWVISTQHRVRLHTSRWVEAVFAELAADPGPVGGAAERLRREARGKGWAPRAAWDGVVFRIDDPAADPWLAAATCGWPAEARQLAVRHAALDATARAAQVRDSALLAQETLPARDAAQVRRRMWLRQQRMSARAVDARRRAEAGAA